METTTKKLLPALITVLLQVAVTLLAVAVFAVVIDIADIDYKYAPVFASVSVGMGAFAAAYYLSAKRKSKGILNGATVGISALITITLIGLLVNHGGMTINTLFHLIIIVLSSLTGGILGVNRGHKKYY